MSETATAARVVCQIELPGSEYKISAWKVTNNSAVRVGETLAIATKAKDTTANGSVAPSAPAYKRPTKRGKKPGMSAVGTTNNEGDKKMSPEEKQRVERCQADPLKKMLTSLSSIDSLMTEKKVNMPKNSDEIAIVAQSDGIVRKIIPSNDSLVVGVIEECQHPAFYEKTCVVCGAERKDGVTASTKERNDSKDEEKARIMTVSGLTFSVSEKEAQRMTERDRIRLEGLKKLSLVLDLDHTLVHATADPRAEQYIDQEDVRCLLLSVPESMEQKDSKKSGRLQKHFVKMRPHAREFLETAMELFELWVYTAGTREYAEQITLTLARHVVGASLDPLHIFQLRQNLARGEAEFQKAAALKEKDDQRATNDSNDNQNDESKAQMAGKKRKRVAFGEAPQTEKTDGITAEELTKLRSASADADRLETRAQEMRQKMFGSRIVSRTDVGDLGPDVKSLRRIFPDEGAMAAVVDDREDVWAKLREGGKEKGEPPDNLLHVRPYHWQRFVGFADVNNASGADLSRTKDEIMTNSETDCQLQWTADILKRVHDQFYNNEGQQQQSVPQILREMRRGVLMGGKLVLTGLVRRDRQAIRSDAEVVRYAEDMGAEVQQSVTALTTHVVAGREGTNKMLDGRKVHGCFIVKPSWLLDSLWSFTRRNESDYLIGTAPPNSGTVKDTSSSDDDDDLAAEFEQDFMEEA